MKGKKSNSKIKCLKSGWLVAVFCVLVMQLVFVLPMNGETQCEKCKNQCRQKFQEDLRSCDLLGKGMAYNICKREAQRVKEMCNINCEIDYSDCGGNVNGNCQNGYASDPWGNCIPAR